MHDLVALAGSDALVCQVQASLPLVSLSSASVDGDRLRYHLDQRVGPIEFSVNQCGLFDARGQVGRYSAALVLDRANLSVLQVEASFHTASVTLVQRAGGALPFAPSFDTEAHPTVRFRTSAITTSGLAKYSVRGLMEIAGVTRLQVLEAELVGQHVDPISGTRVAEARINQRVIGSAFGMLPGQVFIGDRIDISLRARIELEA